MIEPYAVRVRARVLDVTSKINRFILYSFRTKSVTTQQYSSDQYRPNSSFPNIQDSKVAKPVVVKVHFCVARATTTTMRLSYRYMALWISSTGLASSFSPRVFKAATRRTVAFMSSLPGKEDSLRVGLLQFHVTHDKNVNQETAKNYLKRATNQGAQLVVLPEIWNSPYATAAFPEYAEVLPSVGANSCPDSPSAEILRQHAQEHEMWIVGGSIPERDHQGKIYNTCLVFNPQGEVAAKHRKVHLFDISVPGGITFKESETLTAGNELTHFSTPWGNIGLGICYDIRFSEYSLLLTKEYDCRVLIYPGAFNLTTGPAHWEILQRARANDNQCFVLTVSPARNEAPDNTSKYPHYTAWGHSTVVSPWGDVVKKANEKESIVIADLDLSKVEEIRSSIPITKQKRNDIYRLEKSRLF